ncbi:MAG: DeoR/GlpR family DNA-binding transcription regulator [Acidimicrobiia bacterium]|nr:DeoR/GlpR family DNA-binding transcription regulator [Acidimicrobiia bacterium]
MSENKPEAPPIGRLLAARRRDVIRREVERHGGARVRDLVELLGVSPMTIRRDIDVLADDGHVLRVHGGAAINPKSGPASSDEPSFDAKSRRQFGEKFAIASAAFEMIKPGSSIGITAGTTTVQLAGLLSEIEDLLVVTNSVAVAELLPGKQRRNVTVLVTGGIRTPSRALVGPVADSALANLHLDQLFLGVHGMAEGTGYTSPNLLEAQTLKVFVEASESVIVLADHTKWGTVGLSSIGPLGIADAIVTDRLMSDEAISTLEGQVGRVIVAGN